MAKPKSTRDSKRRRRRVARSTIVLRWLAVAVTAVCALFYYGPLKAYAEKREALKTREAEVRGLAREHQQLERRLTASATRQALLLEARRLGFVKPGEKLFIVKGIPAWQRAHASTIERDGK